MSAKLSLLVNSFVRLFRARFLHVPVSQSLRCVHGFSCQGTCLLSAVCLWLLFTEHLLIPVCVHSLPSKCACFLSAVLLSHHL